MTNVRKIILLFVLIVFSSSFLYSQEKVSSLVKEAYNKETPDTLKIKDFLQLADYYQKNDPEKGLIYIKNAIAISKKIKNSYFLAKSYLIKGYIEYSLTENFLALESYRWVIKYSKGSKDYKTICDVYNDIGLVYYDLGNHQKALENFQKSLKISQKHNLLIRVSKTYNNIGLIYYNWKLYDISLEYHFKALKIRKKLKSNKYIASSYNNIGNVYSEMPEKRHLAFKYYKLALNLKLKLKNKRSLANTYNNFGYYYLAINKLDSAEYYFNISLKLKEEINNQKGIASTLNNLCKVYIKKGKLDQAYKTEKQSLEIAKSNKLIDKIAVGYQNMAEIFEKKNDLKKSLSYYKKYVTLKDSIFNQKKYLIITQLENMYIDESKTKKIELLEKDKKIKELTIKQYQSTKKIFWLIIVIIIILLIIAIYISRYNKKIAKENKYKNTELEMANKLLIESENKLIESNNAKDKFFSIISHDIKNSFNVILGITQVLAKKNKTIDDDKKQYYNEIVYKASRNLNDLLENLLNWSKTQTGKIEINNEIFKLNEIIESNIDILKLNASEKNVNIVTNLSTDVVILSDKNMISTIIRNLINNSIKYSYENSIIEVKLYETPEIIKIVIKDFGIGIAPNTLEKLNNGEVITSQFGTNNEKGTGLGLTIVFEFLKYLNGQLLIESELNSGTTFSVILPNKKFKTQSI